MSRMKEAFQKGKALVAFLTCGDPNLETTEALIKAMADAGVDIIELGIPFSDPTAEGPVIQAANLRALSAGTTTDKIFDMVKRVRKSVQVPMVFMTYANVVFSYGTDRFLKTTAEIGMDGLILPDVPFEEKDEFSIPCKKYGLDFIPLVAPTSQNRILTIAREAEGFVYCVSSLGVTGVRAQISSDVDAMVGLVRNATTTPLAIGFGISTAEQASDMAKKADGVIIGSAIVKIIAEHGCQSVPFVSDYVKSIKDALERLK